MRAPREAGRLPAGAQRKADPLDVPPLELFEAQLKGSGEREISTTMALVRMLTALVRDKKIGKHIVPIVPDEARTFGMEGMFRQIGIYSSQGQLYDAAGSDQLMYYREDKKGQILEEGINEAGAMSPGSPRPPPMPTTACHDSVLHLLLDVRLPACRRLAWAAGDMQARGFLIGGTAGQDDAGWRGPAAPGWPQPYAGCDDSELHWIRSRLCLRTGRLSCRTGCGGCLRRWRSGSSITSPA